jgi:hypothetical protein
MSFGDFPSHPPDIAGESSTIPDILPNEYSDSWMCDWPDTGGSPESIYCDDMSFGDFPSCPPDIPGESSTIPDILPNEYSDSHQSNGSLRFPAPELSSLQPEASQTIKLRSTYESLP